MSGDDRFQVRDDLVVEDIDGEYVIVDLEQNEYFGINEVGREIWEHLSAGLSVDDIIRALVTEFEVDQGTASLDARSFIRELLEAALIRAAHAP